MARPLFTGNYGSSLGNYSTAGQLLAARGQALGQAFQSIGSDIAGALEKHKQEKEKKQKEEGVALMAKTFIKSDPDTAKKLFNIDASDDSQVDVVSKAIGKNPESLNLMAGLQQMQTSQQQMQASQQQMQASQQLMEQRRDAYEYGKTLRPQQERETAARLQQLQQSIEASAMALEKAKFEKKVQDRSYDVFKTPTGETALTGKVKDPRVASAAMQLFKQRESAEVKAQQDFAQKQATLVKILAESDKTRAETMKLMQVASPDVYDQLQEVDKNRQAIKNTEVTVAGTKYKVGDLLKMQQDDPKSYKKLSKRLEDPSGPYQIALILLNQMELQEQQLKGQAKVLVEDGSDEYGPPKPEPIDQSTQVQPVEKLPSSSVLDKTLPEAIGEILSKGKLKKGEAEQILYDIGTYAGQ